MKKEIAAAPTVLVIDDNQSALDWARTALQTAGYRVQTRNRGTGSVGAILTGKPDVVLLGVNMSVLSGEAIAKILSRTQPRPLTVVLLYASLPLETLRLKALSSGAHGYVQKSDNSADLVHRIEHWVARVRPPPSSAKVRTSPALADVFAAASDNGDRPNISVDVATESAAVPTPRTLHENSSAPVGPKVLFVDDDWSTLRSYRTTIGSSLQAEYTTSGEEALARLLSSEPPDIVICDIVMPLMNGPELYKRAMNADPSWAKRFLFLTGASSTRTVADFANQFDGRVFYKPVPHNRLVQAIRQVQAELGLGSSSER